jgi:hypothetical protein
MGQIFYKLLLSSRSVLTTARPKSNHPQLVTIPCGEQGAAAILQIAMRNYGDTCPVIKTQIGLRPSDWRDFSDN